ncbi:MAG: ATP-binding protein [bacterium]
MSVKKEKRDMLLPLAEEQRKLRELESLLVQVTQELEERQKALERVTEELLSIRNFTQSVLQSLTSGLISVDQNGNITYMNRGAERILQYSAEEVMGKPLGTAMASKQYKDLLKGRAAKQQVLSHREINITRKDGVEIPVGFTISPHLNESGKEIGKIIHFRDLTEIKEMQEELLRMDRLISLGEIAMGIAHEIRNPLAGIRITAQALEEEVAHNPTWREYVGRIISEIDRLNGLLKSFFSFAKPQQPQLAPCWLPKLVEEVLFLLRKDLENRGIRVENTHAQELPQIYVDEGQIKQVLFNLCMNAMQAMEQGGTLRIHTDQAIAAGRREMVLTVTDTGKGISPEHQSRIFDPFFTTKAKGLGLGLSITYRIIQRHKGRIRVQSEPGRGTTFFVHLPVETE